MNDDHFEFVETPDGQFLMLQDKVSSRTISYITLLCELRNTKEPELFEEGMEMLKRLRMSILNHAEANVSVMRGGKGN